MVKIPRAQSTSDYSYATKPNIPVSYGTDVGRAMQGLGQSIGQFGNAIGSAFEKMEGEAEKRQEYQNNLALLKTGNDLNAMYADLTNQYETGQLTREQFDSKWNEGYQLRTQRLYQEAPPVNDRQQYKYDYQIEGWRGGYQTKNIELHDRIGREKTYNETAAAITGELTPLLGVPDSKFQDAFMARTTGISRMIEQMPLSEANKQRLRDWGAQEAVGYIQRRFKDRVDGLPWAMNWLKGWQAETQRQAQEVQKGRPPGMMRLGGPVGAEGPQGPQDVEASRRYLLSRLVNSKRRGDVIGLKSKMQTRLSSFLQAAEEAGHDIKIISGHRSVERQRALWNRALKKYGSASCARKWVAPPGRSRHNSGMAVDLSYGDRGRGLGGKKTASVRWAHANAKRFGLHFRMGHEDWHIEPTGGAAPTQVASNITPPMALGGPVGDVGAGGPPLPVANIVPPLPMQGSFDPPPLPTQGLDRGEFSVAIDDADADEPPLPQQNDQEAPPLPEQGIDRDPSLPEQMVIEEYDLGPGGTLGAQGPDTPPLPDQAPERLNIQTLTQTLAVAQPSFQTSFARALIKNLPKMQQDNVVARRLMEADAEEMRDKQIATIIETGKSHSDWNPEFIAKAWARKPNKVMKLRREIKFAQALHGVVGDAEEVPSDILQAKLYALQDAITSDEGVDPDMLKAYRKAESAVNKIVNLRKTDPAEAVSKHPLVKEVVVGLKFQPARTPEQQQALVAARLEAQKKLGIREEAITKHEAYKLLLPINSAATKDKRALAQELVRVVHETYGPYAEKVLKSATDLARDDSQLERNMISMARNRYVRDAGLDGRQPRSEAPAKKEKPEEDDDWSWFPFWDWWNGTSEIDGKQQGQLPPAAKRNPFKQFE